jgi:gamma-glutamylaminecyclotransferase
MYIFVYGSLRKGLHNNHLLDDAKYIGKFTTINHYIMIGTKSFSYPYLIDPTYLKFNLYSSIADDYSKNIVGEVYEIDNVLMKKLDSLEGHPDYYTRKQIQVENDIAKIYVYAYILENKDIINSIERYINHRFIFVESGDWVKFIFQEKIRVGGHVVQT